MPITIQCPGCERVRTVPDEWAGKRVKCNACGLVMAIPAVIPQGYSTPPPAPTPIPTLEPLPPEAVQCPTLLDASFPSAGPGVFADLSPLAPLPTKKRKKASRWSFGTPTRVLALAAGGVAACALLVGVVWLAISGLSAGSSMPDWTACACPEGTTAITSANIERLYKSRLIHAIRNKSPDGDPLQAFKNQTGTNLDPDGIEFLVMAESNEGTFVMMQTKQDLSFDQIFVSPPKPSDMKSKADFQYFKRNHGGKNAYVARVGPCRYLAGDVREERDFTDALERVAAGKRTKLGESLQAALDQVGNADFVTATTQVPGNSTGRPGMSTRRPGMSRPMPGMGGLGNLGRMKAIGVGCSMGSSLTIRGCCVFHDREDAERCCDEINRAMKKAREAVNMMPDFGMIPSSDRQKFQIMIDALNRLSVSQSGDTLLIRGSWDADDVIEMMDQIPASSMRGVF